MTKTNYISDKFYLGYPVLIVLVRTAAGGVFARTITSSYALDDALFLGFGKDGTTTTALSVGAQLSVNVVSGEQGLFSDIAGAIPADRKLSALVEAGATIATADNGTPYLLESPLSLICSVEEIRERGDYLHLTAKVNARLLDEGLLTADGSVDWQGYNPLIYMGDANNDAFYKKLSAEPTQVGHYLKNWKEKEK